MNALSLDGRVALVTGAASGIGAGTARLLAEAGAQVALADRDVALAEEVAAEIRASGGVAEAFAFDLADPEQCTALIATVEARLGSPWILVNNAGLHDRELLTDSSVEHWERIVAVNARAPLLLAAEAAKRMIAAGDGGRIINVASASLVGQMVKGLATYMSSKGAMAAMTQAAAFELAEHGITVNTVLPGGVDSRGARSATGPAPEGPARRMPPLGFCTPADIAGAVLYFASPMARLTTNQTLCVDGGWTIT